MIRDLLRVCEPLVFLAMCSAAAAAAAAAPAKPKAIGLETIRAVDYVGSRRYALVVGVDDYADGRIPDLTTCQADARAVHALLTDPATGGVARSDAALLLGARATSRNIRKQLLRLRKIPADSTVFVYFSGHGAKEGDEAYWVTQDSEIDALAATAMRDMEIRSFLAKIPAKRVVVMLDCCYAAAMAKGQKTAAGDFSGVLKSFTGKGRAFLMAAGSGQEAIEAKDLKRSVFTYYLVEGLSGEADANTDGVVVLSELTTYVDSHVADEARIRGGLQQPVVTMEQVHEPSKFGLTIDADRIETNRRRTAEAEARLKEHLAKLRQLYLDETLTLDLYQTGRRLVESEPANLDETDRRKLGEYEAMLAGRLAPEKLKRALDAIETPAQRETRLAREAAAAQARRQAERIAALLAKARANDNKAHGRTALAALDELLKLDPAHAEAIALRRKIAAYFGPTIYTEWPFDAAEARRRQEATAAALGLDKHLTLDLGHNVTMDFVLIPAGEFMMGSPASEAGHDSSEGPQHRRILSKPYYMGVYEVTQEQYQAVMSANPSKFQHHKHPVEQVSWNDAAAFCKTLSHKTGRSLRLPTELEWEYGCRAGTTTRFSFGGEDEHYYKYGNYCDCSNTNGLAWQDKEHDDGHDKTAPVGSFRPNAFALYDMHGNVWEWCSDWYEKDYYAKATSPHGPTSGSTRVNRGGSWDSAPKYCRSAFRDRLTPEYRYYDLGFRVVLGCPEQ